MVFFITNGLEKETIDLIHTFEKRPIVNEQLQKIGQKYKLDASHFPFDFRLSYSLYKIKNKLEASKNSDYFVLDLEKFVIKNSFNTDFFAMLDQCKIFNFKVKIVYIPTDFLLQTYIQKQTFEGKINISTVSLITHIKQNIELVSTAKKIILDSKLPVLFLPNIIHEFTVIKYVQLRSFLELKYPIKNNFFSPYLKHNKIKNWENLFNGLNKTEFSRYLK